MPSTELTDHKKKFFMEIVVNEILETDVEYLTVVEALEDYNLTEDELSIIHDAVFDELDTIHQRWVDSDN